MSWKDIVKSVNTDLNMYEKLEHLHSQIQEIQNAINDNDLQEYPTSDFQTMVQNIMDFTVLASTDGYTLRYELGTSTSNFTKGSGIVDTRLNGSGDYQTRFVNSDDYRAQEFPNGTPTTANTYNLRIIKS